MVYDKKRSGDPDYDDKVPADQHSLETVSGPNGEEITITETVGPVNADGTHANLDGPTADELDNRPAPGGVAREASTVQVVETADTPPAAAKGKTRS